MKIGDSLKIQTKAFMVGGSLYSRDDRFLGIKVDALAIAVDSPFDSFSDPLPEVIYIKLADILFISSYDGSPLIKEESKSKLVAVI